MLKKIVIPQTKDNLVMQANNNDHCQFGFIFDLTKMDLRSESFILFNYPELITLHN